MAAIIAEPTDRGLTLPANAPTVRITAGAGTAGQKSWNLRRPVTLLGSQRRAHIALHAPQVERIHCVIVMTGRQVLLRDLNTPAGTWVNDQRLEQAALKDGDRIRIGSLCIEVGIQGPQGARLGTAPIPPRPESRQVPSIRLRLDDESPPVPFPGGLALLGSDASADFCLEDGGADPLHALMFECGEQVGLFDLTTPNGTRINDELITSRALEPGDEIQIGQTRLLVDGPARPPAAAAVGGGIGPVTKPRMAGSSTPPPTPKAETAESRAATADPPGQADSRTPQGPPAPSGVGVPQPPSAEGYGKSLKEIEREIAGLMGAIEQTWDRFNDVPDGLDAIEQNPCPSLEEMLRLSRDLDARDAALRGHLHDLARCCEQIGHRERDLAEQASRIHEERLKLFQDQATWAKRKAALARRASELERQEEALRKSPKPPNR